MSAAETSSASAVGVKPAWPPAVSTRAYVRWGAIGGFVGALFMALVMTVAGQAIVGDGIAVVCSMGVALIGLQATSTPTTILGLVLHFVAGTVIGIVVALVTLAVRNRFKGRLAITNMRNGLGIGLLAGFAVWLVWGYPLMTYVFAPAIVQVMGMMMPGSMMMAEEEARAAVASTGFVLAWLVAHLVYGAFWGAITGIGAKRRTTAARPVTAGVGAAR